MGFAVLGAVVRRWGMAGTDGLHVFLAGLTVAGALVMAALGFLTFLSEGRLSCLVQGAAFLVSGLIDVLNIYPFLDDPSPGPLPGALCLDTWYASRCLLGVGVVAAQRWTDRRLPRARRWRTAGLGLGMAVGAAAAAGVLLGVFWPVPKGLLIFRTRPVSRPFETVPAALFFTAGVLGLERRETLPRSLGWAMMVSALGEAVMLSSSVVDDGPYLLSLAMKVAGYGLALAGLVADHVRLTARARWDAGRDHVTGLANARSLDEQLADALAGGAHPVAVALIDVDRFKVVNDRFGHEAGNRILRDVGRRLEAALSPSGTVARYAGDAFVAVLPGTSARRVLPALEQARRRVADAPFAVETPVGPVDQTLTVSIGVAEMGPTSPREALRRADRAAYKAKAAGRNRVVLHEPALDEESIGLFRVGAEYRDRLAAAMEAVNRLAGQVLGPLEAAARRLAGLRTRGRLPAGELDAPLRGVEQAIRVLGSVRRLAAPGDLPEETCERITLAALLEPVLVQLRSMGDSLGVSARTDLDGVEASLICQPAAVRLAVYHLVVRAVEAAARAPRPRLRLSAWGTPGGAEVEVVDNGGGIAAADLDQAGIPFVAAGEGLGIGFYLVRQVTVRHGGRLRLFTKGGSGTVVRLSLPARPPGRTPSPRERLRRLEDGAVELVLDASDCGEGPCDSLTIGSLARRTGLNERTIRSWEKRYGIPRPSRLPNGYRVYRERDVQELIWVRDRILSGRRIGEVVAELRNRADVAAGSPTRPAGPTTEGDGSGLAPGPLWGGDRSPGPSPATTEAR